MTPKDFDRSSIPVLAIKDKSFEYRFFTSLSDCSTQLNVDRKEISQISLRNSYTCSKGWTFIRTDDNSDLEYHIGRFKDKRESLDISILPSSRICDKCKVEKPLNSDFFHKSKPKSKYAKFHFKSTCKDCRKGTHSDRYAAKKIAILNDENLKAKYIYSIYKKLDRKNSRLFALTVEWVKLNIVNSECIYCGFISNGIDRIDNNEGHTVANSVPCCTQCNNARMDNFSHEEFKIIGEAIRQVKLKRNDTDTQSEIIT